MEDKCSKGYILEKVINGEKVVLFRSGEGKIEY